MDSSHTQCSKLHACVIFDCEIDHYYIHLQVAAISPLVYFGVPKSPLIPQLVNQHVIIVDVQSTRVTVGTRLNTCFADEESELQKPQFSSQFETIPTTRKVDNFTLPWQRRSGRSKKEYFYISKCRYYMFH